MRTIKVVVEQVIELTEEKGIIDSGVFSAKIGGREYRIFRGYTQWIAEDRVTGEIITARGETGALVEKILGLDTR